MRSMLGAVLAIAAFATASSAVASQVTDAAEADRVASLPGWGAITGYGLFTGYLTVDETATRHTFYAFAESVASPATAPVILWLNGGPGCSSLGGGFMSELGPFYPTPSGALQKNPHSWNHFANILFIESPHGVGFSFSENDDDLTTGDARTAADSYSFLLKFFQRFPQYAENDLFLSGESYAGHYVPQLAWEIVKGNSYGGQEVNLVGFLLGNPLTVPAVDSFGAVDFWWSHALISDATSAGLKDNCDFAGISPLRLRQLLESQPSVGQRQEALQLLKQGATASRQQQAAMSMRGAGAEVDGGLRKFDDLLCDDFVGRAQDELGNINIYEIYADVCMEIKRGGPQRQMAKMLGAHPAGLASRVAVAAMDHHRTAILSASAPASGTEDPPYEPCVDNEVEWYFNRPEVQAAIHANQTDLAKRHLPGRWTDCSDRVQYSFKDLLQSVLPVYRHLLQAGVQMLVYSGDVDGILPVIGTRRWVADLGLTETAPWQSWYSDTQQVGGYVVEYDGLTFASVRNAGHMVPYTQPERMYHLAQLFLRSASEKAVTKAAAAATAASR